MASKKAKASKRLDARRTNWEKYPTGPSGKHTHRKPGSNKQK